MMGIECYCGNECGIYEFNRDWPFMNEHGMNEYENL
jgi:hypothetical protein